MTRDEPAGDVATELERELVRRARAGDKGAFSHLVRRHHDVVCAALAGQLRDARAADDLAQDVFVRAYTHLGEFDAERRLEPWLLGIARNRALEYMREEMRRRTRHQRGATLAILERAAAEAEAGDVEEREREIAALRACLDGLQGAAVALVRRHYFGREALTEIASAEGKKESALRMQLLRVRAALRSCVEKRLGAEAPAR